LVVRQLAGSHNWIRGAFINELRGGWSNTVEKDSYTNAARGADIVRDAGLVGLPGAPATGGFPHVEFGDGSFISTGGAKPFDILSRVAQATNTSTWVAGRHTVKAGADIQYVEYRDQISFFDGEELGRYVFDGTFTGHAFADFLLGLPRSTGYILPAPDVNPFSTYYSFFAQDSWRPSRRVTIDLGLRYDLRPPMKDRSNQLGNFDPDFPGGRVIVSDEAGLALVPDFVRQSVPNTPFVTAADAGLPETLRRTDKNNFSPRIGVAWRPTDDSRTVVRGGFGLYTVPLLGSVNYSMVATVTAAAVNFANSPANPFVFPNISSASSAQGALPPGSLDFRRANQIDMKDPRTMQWSLAVERDLGWNVGARVSYVGSTTDDLIWSPDLNQVRSNTLGYDAVKQTRPFTDWNVVTTRANDPRSKYHGLGLALDKRFSDGLSLDASYTLASHKSDAGGAVPTNFAAENGATTVDLYRGDADYGNVIYTRRHRFVSTFVYELPFGRGRRVGRDIGRGLDALVGGWDVTGVTLFQSGPFLTPFFSNADPSGTGTTTRGFTSTQRPDQVADGTLDNPSADRYFDASAFVRPSANIGRFGNAGVGILEGPGTRVFSMTVGKAFATAGTSRLRVEMAFSNLFNLENLGVPTMNITSSAFGRITSTQAVDQAGPRTVQFSLRYSF
jgi:outer membrane receptor protein involved in Fe transport